MNRRVELAMAIDPFRPQTHALALEPRILFDAAAASAAEQQHHADASHAATPSTPVEVAPRPASEVPPSSTPALPAPHQLVVIDSRVENREQLAAQLPADTKLLVVDSRTDGLAAITTALAEMGPVDSIQIFSHGESGQFTLGNRTLTSDNIDQASGVLGHWRSELAPGADIQLYGCNVGAGPAGQALVNELAHWTGADVGASSDNTGSAAAGGNWTLEVRSGDVDKAIALSASSLASFQGLLAAGPAVGLSGGTDALLGGQFSFTVNMSNTSADDGYAPFVDLFMPATGKDGNDGATFIAATYLGQPVKSFVLTFDAAGNATHPLARDSSGNPVIVNAASVGMRPGDQMVVLQLPYGSLSQDQPTVAVQVTAQLSNLADTSLSDGAPDLTIRARGGFEFGNDALDNPTVDPSLIEASLHDFVVHPTLVTIDQSINMPEGETVTGPNYPHSQTVTVTPAPGQTLTNVSVTQELPGDIQVTSIVPGAGGTLTSITLRDGTVITDPAVIASTIASDSVFLSAYTITYATLSAPTNTVVNFYVPEAGADGSAVVDPFTGDDTTITFGSPTVSGRWTPADPRDVVPPATDIAFTNTGDGAGASFVAKSLSLIKQATVQADVGTAGLSPGDTLRYTLNVAISDFFAVGENFFGDGSFTITDTLADGQTFNGPATLSVTRGGVTQAIPLIVTSTPNADGTTTLVFDLAESLRTAPSVLVSLGALIGDLAFEDFRDGATTAVISYGATVAQSYTTPHPPHSEINEGDALGNNATVAGTLLVDGFNLTGFDESDGSATTSTIPTRQVDIQLVSINGGSPAATPELHPGDVVTFRMSYDLVTGDYEGFRLTAYMPQPLLNLSGVTWSQGAGIGQWALGPGNTNPDGIDSVTTGPGNSVIFDFGNYVNSSVNGSRVEVQFTLRVGDQPFADQRELDVLAQSDQLTTIVKNHLVSSDVAVITSVAEPVLDIRHGVVSTTHGTVTGTTGTWNAPGTAGVPFQGSVTELAAVNGDVTGIDAGDTLRLATAIENRGGGGAFDVQTTVTLPAGLSFVGNSLAAANLRIYRGDGSLLVAGTDYSVSGNEITFLDAGAVPTLAPGRPGTAADASGANMVVITYEVVVGATIDAARTLQSTAALTHYASVNGGSDFAPVDITELANQQVAAPAVIKNFAGGSLDNSDSSATHTTGSDLAVGESMLYDIVVTLPEGTTQSLRLDDLIPAGLRLDTSFNGGLGYQLITTTAGSAALGADFNGTVTPGAIGAISGTIGNDGAGARLAFTAAGATADNVTNNNSFVVRVRLVTSNVSGNQANRALQNSAQVIYSDPDTDTPNGTVPVDRTVALTGGAPIVTVREPTLQIAQTLITDPGLGFDDGDPVEFTITISNGNGSSDFDAFDISLLDNLPPELNNLTLAEVTYQGAATNNGGPGFEIVGRQLRTAAGANIDIGKGGSIVLRITGVVNASAASEPLFTNTAQVQWTSLNGNTAGTADPAGERTGVDGLLNTGVLNDYRRDSALTFNVAQGIRISRVGGLPDTPAVSPTSAPLEQVTIGEVIRYRVLVLVPEGNNPDYHVQVTLPSGLGFITPDALQNVVRVALISENELTTDANLAISGTLLINGNENSPEAQDITPTLTGAAPTGVFNPALIHVVVNPDGSQTITFDFGNMVNGDPNDPDLEGISLEFNARVLNQASNTAGAVLNVTARELVGGGPRASGNTVGERIVEPAFNGVDKRVIDFNPNPAGATGTATVALSFVENGTLSAFNTHLVDSFPAGSAYTFVSLTLNGTVYTPGTPLPAGITVSTAGGLTVDFDRLDPGAQVRVVYQVTLPNAAAVASSNAVLTWTSLPEDFTSWGGTPVGTDGTANGERTGIGGTPNTYVLAEGAGLGIIQGTLWDDTASATASAVPDGPPLAGQPVSLTWGGVDGNLATAADNRVFTTTTDVNGQYRFGVLPAGVFRIDTPSGTISYPQPLGDLRVRIDTDAASPLGQIVVTLGESATAAANAGYVEQNDAPENHLPAVAPSGLEDVALPIAGLSVTDVDAAGGTLDITLSVLHGTLSLTGVPPGVTATGSATGTLRLSGNLAALNLALANLQYLGNLDYNGTDTLTILTNDRGNTGDANGDGIPTQNPADALSDQDTLQIVLAPVNDQPVAVDDVADATEAGGTDNRLIGVDPAGNLLTNDTDVDIATNGDQLRVITFGLQGGQQVGLPSIGANSVNGLYGTLTVGANGGYQYVVNNDDPTVQALRLSGQTLVERFTYTLSDIEGLRDTAVLTVTIHGANDTPVAVFDVGNAVEAGGVNNTTPGSNATGNVLANDTDVDSAANGETQQVTGVRNVGPLAQGPVSGVNPGTSAGTGTAVIGRYGTLTIGADGTYTYVVFDNDPAVQRMVPGDTLDDVFSYRVTDAAGLDDLTELRIIISGANDNPVASDDHADAQAASTNGNAQESNPAGNVILFPSRPGTIDQPGGNGVDLDVDRTDTPNSLLAVTGIGTGPEAPGVVLSPVAPGTSLANGTAIAGTYALQGGVPVAGDFGTLVIGSDGAFTFDVNSDNLTLQSLQAGQTIDVIYTYRLTDTSGLTDLAQLVITVRGVNDPPVAQNVVALATERGGVANATPGVDPTGDATSASFDPDGDPLTVTFVRAGAEGAGGTDLPVGLAGAVVAGQYGTLTLQSDGTYAYAVDNNNAAVQALRRISDVLIDRFTFTIDDGNGETDQGEVVVLVRGQNDNPVAADDVASALEAGGLHNDQPGVDPTGNVLANDADVDGGEVPADPLDYGETRAVSSFRTGTEAATGTAGVLGTELRGAYGWLTLNADGSYTYRVDNDDPAVEALRLDVDTLTDSFSYTVIDAAGAQDRATLNVTIHGANDTPVAHPVVVVAVEAGGQSNNIPGVDPTGNVVDLIDDVDGSGEIVIAVDIARGIINGVIGTPFRGLYGSILLNIDGTLSYTLDNDNPVVQALRTSSDTLTENFTYQVRDRAGATSSAPLTVIIQGRNDNPVAVDDAAISVEAGGTFNGTPGVDPQIDLVANDTDVDAGDARIVTGIRAGTEAAGGAFTAVGSTLNVIGQYGTLTTAANGNGYTYRLDNSAAAVQALRSGDTLSEVFSYSMRDLAGATDVAQLTITIRGAWDAPVAVNDTAVALANNGAGRTFNPTRNVLANDTDVDLPDVLHVSGIRVGTEAAGGSLVNVPAGTSSLDGTVIDGLYGRLTIGSNGTATYVVDVNNPAVQALGLLEFADEYFTYQATDLGGLNDLAQIHIIVVGLNDPPKGVADAATAIEAGGVNNAQAGVDPTGNVLANDTDVEGDALVVTGFRTGGSTGSGTAGTLGSALRGLYGNLTLNADGSYTYVLDNSLPEVEALRTSGQTLTDTFTYALADIWQAPSSAELRITIDGRNDTPIARDDNATAVEAGGIANQTPGVNPTGNVLVNDSDVDSAANGETLRVLGAGSVGSSAQRVLGVRNAVGDSVVAGQVLAGLYGQLTLNADGSYTYVLDNANPTVQALRNAGETLSESFTYRVSDTAGATSEARLNVLIQGANDAPVARDDSNVAPGERPAPQATGNVLPNDSDVDGGDNLQVVAIRTGAEAGTGTPGAVGQSIAGRYGTLVIHADGSYTYTVDQTNPDVLASAGLGRVLQDVFTYTVADRGGAIDAAQLVIDLDIASPYLAPPGPNYFMYFLDRDYPGAILPDVRPAIYITPVVEQVDTALKISAWGSDGSQLLWQLPPEMGGTSIGAGLGEVPEQHVARAVGQSRRDSDFDLARILGREGRVNLSADGLLTAPSLFIADPEDMVLDVEPPDPQTALGFREQLREAAQRLHPLGPADAFESATRI
ncbi:VCBS domain-containing protein [Variovorax sp. J22R24]|uniref:VCBS domain-containing protein n=1 Tax=Variovorax gracilis TaxID=3053502 RepID=UPI002578B328|nr:VCBS domain-containing protein [Variovorax sp. J22R24]MDM0107949.1 VCBS domain-containing protein [Variovorax sp. J22R24]